MTAVLPVVSRGVGVHVGRKGAQICAAQGNATARIEEPPRYVIHVSINFARYAPCAHEAGLRGRRAGGGALGLGARARFINRTNRGIRLCKVKGPRGHLEAKLPSYMLPSTPMEEFFYWGFPELRLFHTWETCQTLYYSRNAGCFISVYVYFSSLTFRLRCRRAMRCIALQTRVSFKGRNAQLSRSSPDCAETTLTVAHAAFRQDHKRLLFVAAPLCGDFVAGASKMLQYTTAVALLRAFGSVALLQAFGRPQLYGTGSRIACPQMFATTSHLEGLEEQSGTLSEVHCNQMIRTNYQDHKHVTVPTISTETIAKIHGKKRKITRPGPIRHASTLKYLIVPANLFCYGKICDEPLPLC